MRTRRCILSVTIGLTLLTLVAVYRQRKPAVVQPVYERKENILDLPTEHTSMPESESDYPVYHESTLAPQHQYNWEVLSKSPYAEIYSAYFDNRTGVRCPQVKVFGLQDHVKASENPIDYYCKVKYRDGTEECLSTPAKQAPLNPGDERTNSLWAYVFTCSTSNRKLPSFVKLSRHTDCSFASVLLPVTVEFPVMAADKIGFGVCIQTALFQTRQANIRIETVIEGIERNRAMGAGKITLYVYKASVEVMKVLRDYEREGVLEIMNWKMSREAVTKSYYFAESVSIADCLYRNMYRMEYLVFTDLDEIIVPQQHRDWTEMMRTLHKNEVATYQFKHSAILTDMSTQQISVNWTCQGVPLKRKLPFYVTRTLRTPPYPFLEQSKQKSSPRQKLIVNPWLVVSQGIHSKRTSVQKTNGFVKVSPEVGLLYHYREKPLCQRCKSYAVKDHRLHEIAPQLVESIQDQYCHYQ